MSSDIPKLEEVRYVPTSFGRLATLEASRGSWDILLVGYTCSWDILARGQARFARSSTLLRRVLESRALVPMLINDICFNMRLLIRFVSNFFVSLGRVYKRSNWDLKLGYTPAAQIQG